MVEFDDQDLSRLTDAYACFSGIKRPCGSDDTGATTIAYILKPKTLFCIRLASSRVLDAKAVGSARLGVCGVRPP